MPKMDYTLTKLKIRNINLSVFDYFLALMTINILLMTLAGFFYNGSFHFWTYPFSYLGTAYTQEGLSNTTASHIYSTSMAASAILMFLLANHLRKGNSNGNTLRPMFCLICGSGALIAAISPDDTMHTFHVIGSALMVSTLWAMATTYLIGIQEKIGHIRHYVVQFGFLQIPVLAYAAAFFLGLEPIDSILQKTALFGLAIGLLYPTYHLTEKD